MQFRQQLEIHLPPTSAQKGTIHPATSYPQLQRPGLASQEDLQGSKGLWTGCLPSEHQAARQGRKLKRQLWVGKEAAQGKIFKGQTAPGPNVFELLCGLLERALLHTLTGLSWGQSRGSPSPQALWDLWLLGLHPTVLTSSASRPARTGEGLHTQSCFSSKPPHFRKVLSIHLLPKPGPQESP